jgi:hypothetical protein
MSNQVSQKEAVFNAVISVFAHNNVSFVPGSSNALSLMTPSMRSQVNLVLVDGLTDGTISLSKTGMSASEIRAYASSLQSNWLKKDSRLSGGSSSSVAISRPASTRSVRSSSKVEKDAQIKSLRSLLKIKTDPSEIAEIESFINKRINELSSAVSSA